MWAVPPHQCSPSTVWTTGWPKHRERTLLQKLQGRCGWCCRGWEVTPAIMGVGTAWGTWWLSLKVLHLISSLNTQWQGSCGLPGLLATSFMVTFFFPSNVSSPSHRLTRFALTWYQADGENNCHSRLPVTCIYPMSCCELLALILQYLCHSCSCKFLNVSFHLPHHWISFWTIFPVSPNHL